MEDILSDLTVLSSLSQRNCKVGVKGMSTHRGILLFHDALVYVTNEIDDNEV